MNEQARALIDFIILQYLERNAGLNIIPKKGRLYDENCTGETKEGERDNITPQQIINKIKNKFPNGIKEGERDNITPQQIINKIKNKFPNGIEEDDKKRLSLLPYLFTIGNGQKKTMVNTLVNFYPVADLGFVYVDLYSMFFGSDQLDSKIIRRDGTINYPRMIGIYTVFARKGTLNSIYDLYNTESLDTYEFLIPLLIATEKAILSINEAHNIDINRLELQKLTSYSIDVTPLQSIYDDNKASFGNMDFKNKDKYNSILEEIRKGIISRSFIFRPIPRLIANIKFKKAEVS